jgi:cysteine-rich repeat protein
VYVHGSSVCKKAHTYSWCVCVCVCVCKIQTHVKRCRCDDANTEDGDGCSARCKIEEGYVCTKGRKDGQADECSRVVVGSNTQRGAANGAGKPRRRVPKPPPLYVEGSDEWPGASGSGLMQHSNSVPIPKLPNLQDLLSGEDGGILVPAYERQTLLLPDLRFGTQWERAVWNDIKVQRCDTWLCVCVCVCVCIYIYIYILGLRTCNKIMRI